MRLSIIAAVAANGVIGFDGDLPWHLPADLARFKKLTMGHHLIMGRRTFESIGRALPGRVSVVLTRDSSWVCDGALVVHSPEEARHAVRSDSEAFVIGGAAVFAAFLPLADRLHLTRVHASVEGDARFPSFDEVDWTVVETEDHDADARHAHPFSFRVYAREGARPGR